MNGDIMSLMLNDAASTILHLARFVFDFANGRYGHQSSDRCSDDLQISLLLIVTRSPVNLSILEHNVAGIPVPRIKSCTKERRNFFPQKLLPNNKLQRIYDSLKIGPMCALNRLQAYPRTQDCWPSISRCHRAALSNDTKERVLVVPNLVLTLDCNDAPSNRASRVGDVNSSNRSSPFRIGLLPPSIELPEARAMKCR